eukprot:jgi/Mesen1/2750/ME000169S01909
MASTMDVDGDQNMGSMDEEEQEKALVPSVDDFCCPICQDLVFKPVVNVCGHVFCFWCVHRAMSPYAESQCPVCRRQFEHFPRICALLHAFLARAFPRDYAARAAEVHEEEAQRNAFAPNLDEIDGDGYKDRPAAPLLTPVYSGNNGRPQPSPGTAVEQSGGSSPGAAGAVGVARESLGGAAAAGPPHQEGLGGAFNRAPAEARGAPELEGQVAHQEHAQVSSRGPPGAGQEGAGGDGSGPGGGDQERGREQGEELGVRGVSQDRCRAQEGGGTGGAAGAGVSASGMAGVSAADFTCVVCRELLLRPVVINCGHVMCASCTPAAAGGAPL